MNNKKLGTDFEREFVQMLANRGYWVHFINADRTGSQPFDVIAVKNGKAYAFDCKTCSTKRFSIDRLEDNQILAFEKWIACGNTQPMIAIKYKNTVRIAYYAALKAEKAVNIESLMQFYPKNGEGRT